MYGKTVVYDIETEIARDVLNLETDPCNLGEYEAIMDWHRAHTHRRETDVTMTWMETSVVECDARVSCVCRILTFWK